jgi:hypothetical protein
MKQQRPGIKPELMLFKLLPNKEEKIQDKNL